MRALVLLQRWLVARRLFGSLSASRLMVWDRLKPSDGVRTLRLHGRLFAYRPRQDRDLLVAHFCRPLYRIQNSSEQPIRRIVDVGANIGDETFRFRVFHPDAEIVAIEADPDNAAMLRQNFGGDSRVTVLHRALWPNRGTVRIAAGPISQASHVADDGVPVETVTLPELLETYGTIDVLKIDIEGAERAVFSDPQASRWLRDVRMLIVECPDADAPGTTLILATRLLETGIVWRCSVVDEYLVWTQPGVEWTIQREADLSHP
jgi:FkbM family methyltransferase